MKIALRIIIKGRVQGVGYRWFATQSAGLYGIKGTVRNLSNGNVEVVAHGDQNLVYEFVGKLKNGPSLAQVTDTEISDEEYDSSLREFKVIF